MRNTLQRSVRLTGLLTACLWFFSSASAVAYPCGNGWADGSPDGKLSYVTGDGNDGYLCNDPDPPSNNDDDGLNTGNDDDGSAPWFFDEQVPSGSWEEIAKAEEDNLFGANSDRFEWNNKWWSLTLNAGYFFCNNGALGNSLEDSPGSGADKCDATFSITSPDQAAGDGLTVTTGSNFDDGAAIDVNADGNAAAPAEEDDLPQQVRLGSWEIVLTEWSAATGGTEVASGENVNASPTEVWGDLALVVKDGTAVDSVSWAAYYIVDEDTDGKISGDFYTGVGAGALSHLTIYGIQSGTSVPEPGTLALAGLGMLAVWSVRRRQRRLSVT